MAKPKCLRDFTNLNRIYKAHWTNVWWIMKVFQVHSNYWFWMSGSHLLSEVLLRYNWYSTLAHLYHISYIYIFKSFRRYITLAQFRTTLSCQWQLKVEAISSNYPQKDTFRPYKVTFGLHFSRRAGYLSHNMDSVQAFLWSDWIWAVTASANEISTEAGYHWDCLTDGIRACDSNLVNYPSDIKIGLNWLVMSQFCTCHDGIAIVACAKSWHE